MNPLCPNCQTELTDDFGFVDCKSCGAVCSIDLEDNVTVQGDEPLEAVSAEEHEEVYEAAVDEVAEVEEEAFVEGLSPEEEQEEVVSYEAVVEKPLEVEASAEEVEEELLEESAQDYMTPDQPEEVMASADELEERPALEEEVEPLGGSVEAESEELFEEEASSAGVSFVASLSGEDFLKDLEVFSEESTTDGGHIYYDFHVAGLDSSGIRENFIETLADSRLEISEDAVREILGDSNDFTLPQISFLRLTVIYKRLLTLGLDMSWSLSEVQEPVSYMVEELAEPEEYYEEGEDDGGVIYEEAEEDY